MKNPLFSELIKEVLAIDVSRYKNKEIVKSTHSCRIRHHAEMLETWGMLRINQISVSMIQSRLDLIRAEGKFSKARRWRRQLIEVYNEAQRRDLIPIGFNPAAVSRQYKVIIQRSRLNLKSYLAVLGLAEKIAPKWVKNMLLLALVTGQRRSDLINLKFSDIWDDYLHIVQIKTGQKVAIPLKLKCDALNMTLDQLVSLCISDSSSDYLISNHSKKINPWSLSKWFNVLYTKSHGVWDKAGVQPSLHEIRSLSERLYRDQNLDSRRILGHKSQSTTDLYNDDRGIGWMMVQLP